MNRAKIEERFLDLVEGRIPELEAAALRSVIENDAELSKSFRAYQKVIELEQALAKEHRAAGAAFSVEVMNKIEEANVGFFRRLFMELNRPIIGKKFLAGSLVCALAVVVVKTTFLPNQPLPPFQNVGGLLDAPFAGQSGGVIESAPWQQAESVPSGPSFPDSRISSGSEENAKNLSLSDRQLLESAPPVARAYAPLQGSAPISILPPPWTQPNTEQYIGYGENPRISVMQEAVSTFSIDVDTGSYTNVRRFLERGVLPPQDAVRIEEFINYFSYDYPTQYDRPFSVSYEIAPAPLDKGRHLLKLGVKARDVEPNSKGWNLVFLVDVSGSMADSSKLELVKRSLPLLVEKMRPEDRIAIVAYAGNAGIKLESSTIKDKTKILSAISNLYAGGSTYGSGGIELAYQVAAQNMIAGGVNRVILTTDGDFNVGVTSHQELLRLIEEKRRSGITLTTLGVGAGNLKDGTMEQLANKGNGNYFYLDNFKEARKVLETDLVGNMEVVAKDVKLQIEFNPQHVAEYRLVGYENRKLENQDFKNDQVDAGEIGSGHTVTALYEVVLAGSELSKQLETERRYQKPAQTQKLEALPGFESELAFLKVRFKQPDAQSSEELRFPIEAKDVKSSVGEASNDFRFAAAVSYLGHLLRNSKFKGEYTFQDVIELAANAVGEDKLGYRREFIELVKNAKAGSAAR